MTQQQDDTQSVRPDPAATAAKDAANTASVQEAAGGETVPPVRGLDVATRRGLAVLCAALFLLYGTYAWVRHIRFVTTGFDLGIFDQATRDYAHFRAPIVPLKAPGYNLLGDHFHPIIALWAPLYWIWADPRMLLLAQAALVSASMIPVVRFVARRWGGGRALCVGLAYGLSWPLQRMVQFDVHEIAFAVPLIAVIIDAMDRRADRWTVAACAALLLVREDMGAFVLLVAVLIALRRPRRATAQAAGDNAAGAGGDAGADAAAADDRAWGAGWRGRRGSVTLGAALAVLAVAGYKLATSVVIPHFSGGLGFVYWTFPALGPDLATAARFTLMHPWSVLKLMVTPWEKAHTLLMLGLPTLYLGLASPYLLLALPFIAQRMLNSRALLWSTNFHYSSVLAPILVMAAVDSAHRLLGPVQRWWNRRGERGFRPADLWIAWAIGVVVVAMAVQAGDYPVSRIWTGRFWVRDSRVQAIEETLPLIPHNVCIEADNAIAPQLTGVDYVLRAGLSGATAAASDGLATWMVLDFSRGDTGWEGTRPALAYDRALTRGFQVVSQRGVIVLLQRPGAAVYPVCRVT